MRNEEGGSNVLLGRPGSLVGLDEFVTGVGVDVPVSGGRGGRGGEFWEFWEFSIVLAPLSKSGEIPHGGLPGLTTQFGVVLGEEEREEERERGMEGEMEGGTFFSQGVVRAIGL